MRGRVSESTLGLSSIPGRAIAPRTRFVCVRLLITCPRIDLYTRARAEKNSAVAAKPSRCCYGKVAGSETILSVSPGEPGYPLSGLVSSEMYYLP